MYAIKTTKAAANVVQVAEARQHLNLPETTTYDRKLSDFISAAERFVETNTNRAAGVAEYQLTLPALPGTNEAIPLPRSPLLAVSLFEYRDQVDGTYQTWDSADYTVANQFEPGVIYPVTSWPAYMLTLDSIRITYTAGYTKLPAAYQQAVLALVDHWYENRGVTAPSVGELPLSVRALIQQLNIGDEFTVYG